MKQSNDDLDWAEFDAMHGRLIAWGRIIVIGGKGPAQRWDSDTPRERLEFTPQERDAAYQLHIKVGQLPELRQRLVLPEHYANTECEGWDLISDGRRRAIISSMVDAVNAGIRTYIRQQREYLPQIRADDFESIRRRSILALIKREAVASRPQFSGYTPAVATKCLTGTTTSA